MSGRTDGELVVTAALGIVAIAFTVFASFKPEAADLLFAIWVALLAVCFLILHWLRRPA
ncbi:MAG: hypothetical protein HZA53_10130 [Planctomycetes bacterium]|nr:hypothetical protein [Planctomycetota bacterium]